MSSENQIRARFYLPKEEYEKLKQLKKRYRFEISKICQILLIRVLKNKDTELF